MAGRLVLIAQAETQAARAGAFPNNESLSDRGRIAAAERRHSMRRAPRAMTGPEPAACATAEALGLAAGVEPALRDLDVGSWSGRELTEIAIADERSAKSFLVDPSFAGHGGESLEAFVARIGRWLHERRAEEGTAIVVASAPVVRAAIAAALGASAPVFWRIDVAALDACELSTDGRRWTLRRLGPLGSR